MKKKKLKEAVRGKNKIRISTPTKRASDPKVGGEKKKKISGHRGSG